jgi:hypothetical protein
MGEATPSLLFLALAAGFAVGLLAGNWWGLRRGAEKERLRVDLVFYATTNVVYGGSIQTVWDCVAGHITKDEMIARLRRSHERKERSKKRLAECEEQLYAAKKGASDDEGSKRA